MYDPLKNWGAVGGKSMTVGVIGIGGLGTMGIKLAKALGHRVVAISTSPNKEAMAKDLLFTQITHLEFGMAI